MRGLIGQFIPRILSSRLDVHVFYTCAIVCKSYEGCHVLFRMNMSWVVMSPRFAIHVHDSALRTCEGGHPLFKRGVSQVGRCPCSAKRMGAISIVNGNV